MQYWQDLELGSEFLTDSITLSAANIIDFATDFDPQPYHLNPQVAAESIFGGHCASGWQVCALMMRLLVDALERERIVSAGNTDVESLRWFIPVFAEDSLTAHITISGKSESAEHPEYGLAHFDVDVTNQHAKSVIKLTTRMLIRQNTESFTHEQA